MRLLFIIISIFSLSNAFANPVTVSDVGLDESGKNFCYTLSSDSPVRIRVGSAQGPMYLTLVNNEQRKAGVNTESWNFQETTGIDFNRFSPITYSIDPSPHHHPDIKLSVSQKWTKPDSLTLTVDIPKSDYSWFAEKGVELKAFLNNRLVRLSRPKTFPQTLSFTIKPSPQTRLLTINAWSGDHASVAYANILLEPKEHGSPKNGKLAYCQRVKGFWQVFTADLDGSRATQITDAEMDKRYPAVSPDAKQLAYVTNTGELWITDMDGKTSRKVSLPVQCSQPKWSRNGEKIMFVSFHDLYHGNSEIWQVELATGQLSKLTNRPWLQYDSSFSPDEAAVLLTDGPELYQQEIRKLNLKTGDFTPITDNKPYQYDMQASFSPDGKSIVYASNESGNYDIWLADASGMNKTNLTNDPGHDTNPGFDPTGKFVYFLSDRSGGTQILRMDINGRNATQISSGNEEKIDLSIY